MERHDLLVRGGVCVTPSGIIATDIGIRDGRVSLLGDARGHEAEQVIEARGLHVLPGLIDAHVHLRDPGDASVESLATGTRGAVLGGLASVFDMPNTTPPIVDAAAVSQKRAAIEQHAHCDVGIYVGASRGNLGTLAGLEALPGVCGVKLFAGSTTGSLLIEDDDGIEQAMRDGRRRIAFHAEDEGRLQARRPMFEGSHDPRDHPRWRDEECAFLGTRRIVSLARRTGRPAHIVHVSTAEELDWLAAHRDLVTVEVLVNHLTQVAPECYERLGGYAVMNPPIRDARHRDAAWAAVRDGRVDTVGSDHAPHSRAAKERPWPETAAGLTGVQTIVPLMLDHVNAGRLSLERLVDLMAAGPARVFGARRKGRLAVGYDGDLTIVDMRRSQMIENAWIASPVGWTPFDGVRVTGWPVATVVRGRVAMRDGAVFEPAGQTIAFG